MVMPRWMLVGLLGIAGLAFWMFALLLGLSPPDRLQWAGHFMIGILLVLSYYAAKSVCYRRDRR